MNSLEHLSDSLSKRVSTFAWTESDVVAGNGEDFFLTRLLQEILCDFKSEFPQIIHAYAAVSSIKSAYFVPVASIQRTLLSIVHIPSHPRKLTCAISKYLWSGDDFQIINGINKDPDYKGDPNCSDKVLIRLISKGDFFGFLSLDGTAPFGFEGSSSACQAIATKLGKILADAIFTHRLRKLALSFHKGKLPSLNTLYDEIAATAALAFGADGAVLRILDPNDDKLPPEGIDGEVQAMQLEPDSPAERMARRILESPERPFAVVSDDGHSKPQEIGMALPQDLRTSLSDIGMYAFMLIRLQSDPLAKEPKGALGTLAVFHLRPHHYSWRDLGLFLTYAKRAADEITINIQRINLEQTNKKLTAAQKEITDTQGIVDELNQNSIRGEMLAYLRHDLGHKAIAVEQSFDEFTEAAKRAIRERMSWDRMQPPHGKMILAIEDIRTTVNSFFEMSSGAQAVEKPFDVKETITSLSNTLRPGLRRYNMDIEVRADLGIVILGNIEIFRHILFNLINNSREAHVRRGARAQNIISISAKKVLEGNSHFVVIQHSDQGPGIDRKLFSNPHDEIFKAYTTAKPKDTPGAGLGLFLSRQALTRYFRGQLILADPAHAVFQIKIQSV